MVVIDFLRSVVILENVVVKIIIGYLLWNIIGEIIFINVDIVCVFEILWREKILKFN